MDSLVISGLKFHAKHGVFEDEKIHGNHFVIDITFKMDLQTSAQSDSLSQTIDYSKVVEITKSIMLGESVDLIEHLAYKIGEELYRKFTLAKKIKVCVRKLNPPTETPFEYSKVILKWPR